MSQLFPDLIGSLDGHKPNGDAYPRYRIMLHAERGEVETVNDVFGRQVDDDRLIDGQIQLVDCRDIVFCVGVRPVQSKWIIGVNKFNVSSTELSVGTGIMDVPCELFSNDVDVNCVFLGGEVINALRPERIVEPRNQATAIDPSEDATPSPEND